MKRMNKSYIAWETISDGYVLHNSDYRRNTEII